MSRFNNPQTPQPPRGVPQQAAPVRQEPRPAAPPTNPYGSLSSYGQQGYAPAEAQPQPQPQSGAYGALRADPRYPQPAADPYANGGYATPADSYGALAGQHVNGYAAPVPAYDPYAQAAPQNGYAAQGYPAQTGYAPAQSAQPGQSAQGYQDPYAARADLRSASFDQWSPGALPQADPYAGGGQGQANGYEPQAYEGQGFDAQGFPVGRAPAAAAPAHWGAAADPYAQQGYGAQPNGFDAAGNGFDAQGTYAAGAHPQQAGSSFEQGYAEDEAEYEDEEAAPRSFKRLAILLASTVIVGGGLALAYVNLTSSSAPTTTASAPVVKGDESPFKVKPSDPGGKQFAHTDSKVMGRLGEGTAASGSSSGDVDPVTGARKVSTMVVGRDGSIQSGGADGGASPAVPTTTAIPGMVVVGVPPAVASSDTAQQAAAPAPAEAPPAEKTMTASEPAAPAATAGTPKKPQMIATASVPPSTATASVAAPAAAVTPPPKKEKKVAAATPAAVPASTGAPAAATAPRATGAGYVAVLASVPASGSSRIDALKQFADLQQKYGSILAEKTPDVQEANLGAKGTYHRLIVGPPGSREGANQVCTQLKAQGYASCWVMAY